MKEARWSHRSTWRIWVWGPLLAIVSTCLFGYLAFLLVHPSEALAPTRDAAFQNGAAGIGGAVGLLFAATVVARCAGRGVSGWVTGFWAAFGGSVLNCLIFGAISRKFDALEFVFTGIIIFGPFWLILGIPTLFGAKFHDERVKEMGR